MHIERPVRMQMWIAAIAIGLLVASAIFAIVRSIAISYANPPDRSARASQDVGASGSRDARPEEVLARDAAAVDP